MKSLLFSLLIPVLLTACAAQPDIIGKWRSPDDGGTLEFRKDGTFQAIDNMGGKAKGTYKILPDGKLRFEVTESDIMSERFHPIIPHEVIDVTVSVTDTELRLTHSDDEPEAYVRSD